MGIRVYILGLLAILCMNPVTKRISVLPDHQAILYSGRMAFNDPLNPTFSMSASGFKVRFEGSSLSGRFSTEDGNSYLYVIVDGKDDPHNRRIVEINSLNEDTYLLADGLPEGAHSIEVIKLTESYTKVTFHGLILSGVKLLPKPERPKIKLEFVGDSNTAGWCAWDAYDEGGNESSGAYFTFPGLTAKMLDAEYSLIGGSSSGVTDKAAWNLCKSYEKIHLQEEASELNNWNFNSNYWGFTPHAVIINLGANDYYGGATKNEIMNGWKDFIKNKVRNYYPDCHVVLANSYGWAFNEPADYVHEIVDYFHNQGDTKVSAVLFPWLWGQTHAVVNEHAGFSNILAPHLAEVLGLEAPVLSEISSFTKKGKVYNGGFEKSFIQGVADGWRPHGSAQLFSDANIAYEGANFVRLKNGAWLNYPATVETGMNLKLSGQVRSQQGTQFGFIKILFKDQAQNTIHSKQMRFMAGDKWEQQEILAKVPDKAWSAWVVLEADRDSEIDIDQVEMSVSTN